MKKEFNHEKIKEAIRTILTELGDDPDREGLKDTPDRVARMYDEIFDEQMASLEKCNTYEAPMVYTLSDKKICLMLDFYGCEKEDMGYVPFVMESLDSINLKCSKEKFTFPYKFKHGVVMEITGDEYERIKKHKWINKK